MQYEVTQLNPDKPLGTGMISLSADGMCLFLAPDGIQVVAVMERTQVEWIQSMGILINGFTQAGVRRGKPCFEYHEWFCKYKGDVPINKLS